MSEESAEEVAASEETTSEESTSTDWRDSIKDETLRKHAERFDSPEAVVKGNYEQRQKLSNTIVPLGKDATDEDLATYRKSIGVPETSDKYELNFGEDTDEAAVDYWQKVFHENNVNPDVANQLIDTVNNLAEEQSAEKVKADSKYAEAAEADLREEWEGPEYDKNIEYYKRAANELLGEDYEAIRTLEDGTGRFVMDNPILVKAFAKIGREMGEGRLGALPVSDDDLQSMISQADEYREKANAANDAGKFAEAKRWDAKETEILGRIPE